MVIETLERFGSAVQEKKDLWNLPKITLRPLNQIKWVFQDLIEADFAWFKQCKMVPMPERAEKLLLSEGVGVLEMALVSGFV